MVFLESSNPTAYQTLGDTDNILTIGFSGLHYPSEIHLCKIIMRVFSSMLVHILNFYNVLLWLKYIQTKLTILAILKCIIQWRLVYLQSCTTITTI